MYKPNPRDTSEVTIPSAISDLIEQIAAQVHDTWAIQKIGSGCTDHPDLIPYAELPEAVKDYDRNTAKATLAFILALGYDIVPPEKPKSTPKPLTAIEYAAFDALLVKHRAFLVDKNKAGWIIEYLGNDLTIQCPGGYAGASISDLLPSFMQDLRDLEISFQIRHR